MWQNFHICHLSMLFVYSTNPTLPCWILLSLTISSFFWGGLCLLKSVCINLTNFNTAMEAGAFACPAHLYVWKSHSADMKSWSPPQTLNKCPKDSAQPVQFNEAQSRQCTPPPTHFPTQYLNYHRSNCQPCNRNPSVRKFWLLWKLPIHFSEEYRTQGGSSVEICSFVISRHVYWPLLSYIILISYLSNLLYCHMLGVWHATNNFMPSWM